MSYTTPGDVIDRWVGNDVPHDEDLIQALINDAETIIRAEFPRIDERVADELLPVANIVLAVSRMVSRLLRNPEGLTYWQSNTGPFGQGRNYGENVDIWLSDNERALLAPKQTGKAFSVNLAPDAVSPATSDLWTEAV